MSVLRLGILSIANLMHAVLPVCNQCVDEIGNILPFNINLTASHWYPVKAIQELIRRLIILAKKYFGVGCTSIPSETEHDFSKLLTD